MEKRTESIRCNSNFLGLFLCRKIEKGYFMKKIYRLIDTITATFILVMTCVVVVVLFVAQKENVNLSQVRLILFIVGFYGSIICIALRFVTLYCRVLQLSNLLKKMIIIIYFTVWTLLSVASLVVVIRLTNFSVQHDVLSDYYGYQIFMIVILSAQWLGEKILHD